MNEKIKNISYLLLVSIAFIASKNSTGCPTCVGVPDTNLPALFSEKYDEHWKNLTVSSQETEDSTHKKGE